VGGHDPQDPPDRVRDEHRDRYPCAPDQAVQKHRADAYRDQKKSRIEEFRAGSLPDERAHSGDARGRRNNHRPFQRVESPDEHSEMRENDQIRDHIKRSTSLPSLRDRDRGCARRAAEESDTAIRIRWLEYMRSMRRREAAYFGSICPFNTKSTEPSFKRNTAHVSSI